MSNVINFKKSFLLLERQSCECGAYLEYWLGSDDTAYGLCPRCDLKHAEQVKIDQELNIH